MITLLITTYNRPEYLAKCLDSVKQLSPMPDTILIMDDASTDPETLRLIGDFFVPGVQVGKYHLGKNKGIKNSLSIGCEMAFQSRTDLIINLDGDAIVKPDLIYRLQDLHAQHRCIVSGFNSLNKNKDGSLRNPIFAEHENHFVKKHANGINMCFNLEQYQKYILPALQDAGNWDYNTGAEHFVIAKPSLVQHIGLKSSMGHNQDPDVAADFYELELPTVTLFGIDAHDPEGLRRAADICTRSVKFGDVQIITERLFSGREAYSKFCIADMAAYIKTDHALIIHPDGYIQNPLAWTDEFLQYDYIGSKWQFHDGMNVGNGGFSLRSKKLLDILANLDLSAQRVHPEDDYICRQIRPWLEKEYSIKFATQDLADRFAIEAYGCEMQDTHGRKANQYNGQFGFHGKYVTGLNTPIVHKNKTQEIGIYRPHGRR